MARKSRKNMPVAVAEPTDNLTAKAVLSMDKEAKPYQVGIYARLSFESEANKERDTVDTQIAYIREFINSQDDMVEVEVYADISVTGTTFERPEFDRMIQDIRAGRINTVITRDLSRLGRNYVEAGNYIERVFPFLDVRYIAITDDFDTARPGTDLSVPLKNIVNEYYSKDLSKKVETGKHSIWAQGGFSEGTPPYGYYRATDGSRKLLIDEEVSDNVVRIFNIFLDGKGYAGIAKTLQNEGILSPPKYRYNEVYIGSVINNKTADNIDTGHQVVQRDKEDWIIVENCHEPLVSVEDFKLAHKMIARREVTKRKPNGKWRKSYIRCGICGKGLYKYGNKSSYRCHNGHVSRIRGEELEATLLDIARNMALAQLQEFELKTDGGNCPDNLEREIESLKKSKAHYAKLKFEIYDDYTKTNITRDQMAKKTAEVKQKIAEIESLITEKQETLDMQKDLFLDAKQEQLTKLSKLDEFDEEVIRYLIDYVLVYDNEHIEIRWNFDDFQAG